MSFLKIFLKFVIIYYNIHFKIYFTVLLGKAALRCLLFLIEMEEKLGSGAYGLVIKGTAKGLFPGEEETLVAIKTLQPQADITHFKALLIELKIMSFIGRNPFIVNLLGACTTEIKRRKNKLKNISHIQLTLFIL